MYLYTTGSHLSPNSFWVGAWWCRPVINSSPQQAEAGAWRVCEHSVLWSQNPLHKKKRFFKGLQTIKGNSPCQVRPHLLCAQKEAPLTTSPFLEETGTVFLTEEEPVTGMLMLFPNWKRAESWQLCRQPQIFHYKDGGHKAKFLSWWRSILSGFWLSVQCLGLCWFPYVIEPNKTAQSKKI